MKVLKRDSPPEIKLQKLEALMVELGISIESNNDLYVTIDKLKIWIRDSDQESEVQILPRQFDEERLVIFE
jgi:hypothetical protein